MGDTILVMSHHKPSVNTYHIHESLRILKHSSISQASNKSSMNNRILLRTIEDKTYPISHEK